MRYKSFYAFIVLLFITVDLFSSPADSLKILMKTYKKEGKKSYNNGDVYKAIYYYQEYLKLNAKDVKIAYRLANLNFETRDYNGAKQYYDSVIARSPGKYPESFYHMGIVLMNLGEYDKAQESFAEFRKEFRGFKDPLELRKKAQIYISNSEWAENHSDSIANISIIHLGSSVNQPDIEFSPVLKNPNTLVYGSLRSDYITNEKNELRKLFVAERKDNYWIYKGPFDENINEGNYHTGNPVFSADGKKMYFTRCETNWQNKLICSVYKSQFKDNNWQDPQKLPYPVNDENYTTTQPALGNNLRTGAEILYFVSDRPGTRGGLDIWYCETDRQTGEFKEPKNMGRNINSLEDECSPFYDIVTRTLFFSSKGHKGFGGFDIYRSTGSGKQWTNAQPLPKPINSSFDDTYFTTVSGKEGFFTSNRPGSLNLENGSCCDDIFSFRYNECIKTSVTGKVVNQTNYDFFDELNSRFHLDLKYPEDDIPVKDVPVFVYTADSAGKDILVSQTKSDDNGNFLLDLDMQKEYSLIVKNYGIFDKRHRISTKGLKCEDTITLGVTSVWYIPPITVRLNVYYEHDKSRLTPQAQITIDTALLPLFDLLPNAIIEIGSHTDSTGSDNYNIKLSQRRSESVVKYLTDKGISAERMVAKGYGESMPIAPNTNPDGSDNPENRQLNRRTELRIVGELGSFYYDE